MPKLIRVVVSLQYLRVGRVGGSETYVRKLIKHLGQRSDLRLFVTGEETTLRSLEIPATCTLVPTMSGPYRPALRLYHENWTLSSIARSLNADLLFFPANFGAPLNPSRLPQVVTIHDLQHLELPGNFTRRTQWARRLLFLGTRLRAKHFITVSEFTRTAVIKTLGIPPNRVSTVHHGVEPEVTDEAGTEPPAGAYFMFPATSFPHKNHLTLIQAVSDLLQRTGGATPIILTGARTRHYKTIEREMDRLGVRDYFDHRGFVTRPELWRLMKNARAVVFPSAFEGFGLPILEAMRLGVPVLAANNSAMAEVAGEAAWLLPTYDVGEWSLAMQRILKDIEAQELLRTAGRQRARQFSWSACAEATARIFHQTVEGQRVPPRH